MVELSFNSAPHSAARSTGRVDWIEAFRGIAALGVVFWHTSNYIEPYGEGLTGRVFWPASIFGVDVFFILSGFVMVLATSTRRAAPAPLDFYIRRVIRVLPLYALATLAFVALNPASAPTLQHIVRSLLFLPGMEVADAPVYRFPIMTVGWTLNYEMYFYLAFAISLFFGRWRWTALLTWIFLAVFAIPLAFGTNQFQFLTSENHFPFESAWLNLPTNPIILLFAAGVLCGLLHATGWKIRSNRVSFVLRAGAIALVALQYACSFRVTHSVFGTGLSLVPLVLVFAVTQPCRFVLLRPLLYLGSISYALYVAHPVVIVALRLPLHQGYSGLGAVLLTTLVSLLVAALAHHFFEQPVARWLRQAMNTIPRRQIEAAG
ncbi:acyltransferase [Devosia sp. 919]|uniref:acyltransferase family protein n=1 Tax=Devosia sp. 919 TaxID=2726065 RepID=UPI001554CAE5|nr:acyltransferase [Devosia sp. 919]